MQVVKAAARLIAVPLLLVIAAITAVLCAVLRPAIRRPRSDLAHDDDPSQPNRNV